MRTLTFGVLLTCSALILYVYTQNLEYKDGGNHSNFYYKNCNRSAVPFYVQSLQFGPDPVDLYHEPIKMSLSMNFSLDRTVGEKGNRIDIDLNLRLKTDRGYTELCELIGAQNCHFNDLCAILEKLMKKNKCPHFMIERYDNNCSCPFLKNDYQIKTVPIFLPKRPVPFQIRGTFDLTVNLQEQGKHLGCLHVEFCVTDCKPLGG